MRKHKGYDDYKDSGVEWMGEIPEGWSVLAFKRLGDFQSGAGFPDEEQGLEDEELPFYKVSDTNLAGNERLMTKHNNTVSRETAKMLRAYVFPKDSIIFAKVGAALLLNKRRILTSPSCIDNNMMGFIPRTCNRDWMFYWMCGLDLGELANRGAVPSINERQIREIRVPVLPPKEQRSIAAFLDHKTSEIDALITNKEKLIELLKEQRQTIITEAVTKGLNPDVKMKDTGVEWIGEIPEHWMTIRLKYKAQLIIRKATESESELIYIGLENIEPKTGRLIGDMEQIIDGDALLFERSQVLFNKLRPYLSKCFLATCNGRCSSELFVLNAKSILPKFLYYTMLADLFIQTVNSSTYGVKMPRANWTFVGDVRITVPSSSEQQTIAAFLDHKTSEIDALITKERTQIEKLKSYRQSLIFEAVTGKIDVRDWSDKPLERSEAVANA